MKKHQLFFLFFFSIFFSCFFCEVSSDGSSWTGYPLGLSGKCQLHCSGSWGLGQPNSGGEQVPVSDCYYIKGQAQAFCSACYPCGLSMSIHLCGLWVCVPLWTFNEYTSLWTLYRTPSFVMCSTPVCSRFVFASFGSVCVFLLHCPGVTLCGRQDIKIQWLTKVSLLSCSFLTVVLV